MTEQQEQQDEATTSGESKPKKPRRTLSTTDKLLAMRDSQRTKVRALGEREYKLSRQLREVRAERAKQEAELDRLEKTLPEELRTDFGKPQDEPAQAAQ